MSSGEPYAYAERPPVAGLTGLVSAVWVQHVPAGGTAVAQRHLPHGGAELRCTLGAGPRLAGPSTRPVVELLRPGATVVGVRLRPGAAGLVAGLPAAELVDEDAPAAELWPRAAGPLADRVGTAESAEIALAALQAHLVTCLRTAGPVDPLVSEVVRRLMPWQPGGSAGSEVRTLAATLSISDRQLRRRCLAAVGYGAKELHRVLRFQGFLALVQEAGATTARDAGTARWAAEAGYADQAHLGRECRRLTGLTPREFLAEAAGACGCGHDHAASYGPLLRPRRTARDGRSVHERRAVPA